MPEFMIQASRPADRRGRRTASIIAVAVAAILSTVTTGARAESPNDTEVSAADHAPPGERRSDQLRFRFTVGAWVPRLVGTSTLGGNGFEIDESGLNGSEATIDLALEVRREWWDVRLSGFTFTTRGSTAFPDGGAFGSTVIPPGASGGGSFTWSSAEIEFGAALYRPFADRTFPWSASEPKPDNTASDGDYLVDLRLGPTLAARWLQLDQEYGVVDGPAESGGGDWIAVLIGVRLDVDFRLPDGIPLLHAITVTGAASFGPAFGDEIGTAVAIRADLTLWMTPNLGLVAGYRFMGANVEKDEWSYDGHVAGIFLGGTIRF